LERVEDVGGVVLALLDVGLIERMNSQEMPSHGGGEFPTKEFGAKIVLVALVRLGFNWTCGTNTIVAPNACVGDWPAPWRGLCWGVVRVELNHRLTSLSQSLDLPIKL
jgi:hypothetical protein